MRLSALIITTLIVASCGDTIIQPPTYPAPPTPTPVVATRNQIEFRVNGSATSAIIRYSNPIDGLTQVVTSLPYVIELSTTDKLIFLSLEVTPLSFPTFGTAPFLSVQIFVNGRLFREATSSSSSFNTLSVSGTWRADN